MANIDEQLARIGRYRRATNYLAAAQIYLQSNFMLAGPLRVEDIKPRLLGHWGTAPGINLIYAHLNRLICDHDDASILLVTGPGHGAAANMANLYLEGTLTEYYPKLTLDKTGMGEFIRTFSWPTGFPSHLSPGTPACINEGGELGYALATAFGAAFDNPDLIVACIVGDGEAETGPTATAWHSNKYLDPATSGAVLPILHDNGYKIASPTISGTMSEDELMALYTGYGYAPRIVEAADPWVNSGEELDRALYEALEWAYAGIRAIQQQARSGHRPARPQWPMLILRSPKGWTGVKELNGLPVEGSNRSHQVPIEDAVKNPDHLKMVEDWLRSYHIEELFDDAGRPSPDILSTIPQGDRRMGKNKHGFGGDIREDPSLPAHWEDYAVAVPAPGAKKVSNVTEFSKYLRDTIANSKAKRNFRIVSPDELESNKLSAVLDVTSRAYVWPVKETDQHIAPDGLVMEMLSEHTCQGWLQGYLLTGRHGLFPSYEAFIAITDSMVNQFAKFIKQSKEVPWRKPISSLNYLLTSEGWRQDHNGYSHQMPGFINELMSKKASIIRIYLPPDANCLIQTMDHCFWSKNYINLVIATKQQELQWLTAEQAKEHCERGASIWEWASTDGGVEPDIVMASAGDLVTIELMAAVWLLKQEAPELRVRTVNVTDLMVLDTKADHPHGLTSDAFSALFTADKPVVFNFHGYPSAVRSLLFERPGVERFHIRGYEEEGTTTTPLDMMIRNGTSRWDLVIRAVTASNRLPIEKQDAIVQKYRQKIADHRVYIDKYDVDPDEITNWKWS